MEELAKDIGKVREIAYDPKVSQRSDYIRAKVLFDTSKPARDEKVLNIKDADPVIISYEYEKIRKKCFHCFQLTHEKPQCPMLKKNYKKPIPAITDVCNRGKSSRQGEKLPLILNATDGPPGFPMMFLELSTKDRQMALLYISHPNDVERSARIRRVEMEIEDNKLKEANAIPTLTHDLNKDLGLIFGYKEGSDHIHSISLGGAHQTLSTRHASSESSDQSYAFSLADGCPTGFTVGTSIVPVSRTSGQLKKPRNRPPHGKEEAALLRSCIQARLQERLLTTRYMELARVKQS